MAYPVYEYCKNATSVLCKCYPSLPETQREKTSSKVDLPLFLHEPTLKSTTMSRPCQPDYLGRMIKDVWEWRQHNIHHPNLSVDAEMCCFPQCLQVSHSFVVSFEVQQQLKSKEIVSICIPQGTYKYA